MLEEQKLANLKKELISYATLVESMIEKGIVGLKDKKMDLLTEVIEKDEPEANAYELKLEDVCITMIAQHQPKGKSLRTILMCYKINDTLERMADQAVNIVESAIFLIDKPEVKPLIDIPKMQELTIQMVKDSVDAFVNEDAKLGKEVCERDNIADQLSDRILKDLTEFMQKDPATIVRSLHLLRITGGLERIADLSTNICEDVIYMAEGRIIKHHFGCKV